MSLFSVLVPYSRSGESAVASIMARTGAVLRVVSGIALLAVVMVAPWLRGGGPPAAIQLLQSILLGITGMWLAASVAERRVPCIGWVPGVCVVVLLAQGLWMSCNAGTAYDAAAGEFRVAAAAAPGWPGAVDGSVAGSQMLLMAGLLGALLIMADLGRERDWRRGAWVATGVSGALLAGYGILQKVGLVPELNEYPHHPESVFASFADHGTAGAFINLSLVLCLIAAVLLWRRSSGHRLTMMVTVAAAVCLAAAFVNISRTGMAVAGLIVLVVGIATFRLSNPGRARWLFPAVVLCGGAMVALTTLSAVQRWEELSESLHAENGRLLMWRSALPMIVDGGALGHGPGSFKLMLPHTPHLVRELYSNWIVTPHTPGAEVSRWSHAHNDYIQTLVEWGWLGGAVWGVLVFGGMWVCWRAWRNARPASEVDAALAAAVGLGMVVVLLHALVDFPFQNAAVQLWVAVLLGLAWSSGGWQKLNIVEQAREGQDGSPASAGSGSAGVARE
jgi:O-antigen ligase